MKCGREYGGRKGKKSGVCRAFTEIRVNGLHGGKNGGRVCWVVTGTKCKGNSNLKIQDCLECVFYMKVKDEEKTHFKKINELMAYLK